MSCLSAGENGSSGTDTVRPHGLSLDKRLKMSLLNGMVWDSSFALIQVWQRSTVSGFYRMPPPLVLCPGCGQSCRNRAFPRCRGPSDISRSSDGTRTILKVDQEFRRICSTSWGIFFPGSPDTTKFSPDPAGNRSDRIRAVRSPAFLASL